ncbi:c-type cytochrome [Lichenibacterium dinghuense]|uniref:c-type cytochrome n=1 Tax=Lichenibacterium dinghuense TaxID=2895977 RepID=UPI001F0084C0|nr:c-type cytochrome [Lichenibacterium sp. 6Y81]
MRRGLILAGGAAVVAIVAAAALLPGAPPHPAGASAAGGAADPGRGASVFGACSACHTVGRGGADVDGPNLYGVVGSRVAGRRPRYGYTQALRDAGGTWTEDRLSAWLTDPAAFAPGTAMHFAGLPDARDRADVIAFLATQAPARE